jgi:hypothetical protein
MENDECRDIRTAVTPCDTGGRCPATPDAGERKTECIGWEDLMAWLYVV